MPNVLCPFCHKSLINAKVAFYPLDEPDKARLLDLGLNPAAELRRAFEDLAQNSEGRVWLSHRKLSDRELSDQELRDRGCMVKHPYWGCLEIFSEIGIQMPLTAPSGGHQDVKSDDFLVYHRVHSYSKNSAPGNSEDNQHAIKALLGVPFCIAIRVKGWLQSYQSGDMQNEILRTKLLEKQTGLETHPEKDAGLIALLTTIHDGIPGDNSRADDTLLQDWIRRVNNYLSGKNNEAWFPYWLISDKNHLVRMALIGKTQVGKTILSLQALHRGGYPGFQPGAMLISRKFVFSPVPGELIPGGNYQEWPDILTHWSLHGLIHGDTRPPKPPATAKAPGNLKAILFESGGGSPPARVQKCLKGFWNRFKATSSGQHQEGRGILFVDAPGEHAMQADGELQDLLRVANGLVFFMQAEELFNDPSGNDNTLDVVNENLTKLIERLRDNAWPTDLPKCAIIVNKLDELRDYPADVSKYPRADFPTGNCFSEFYLNWRRTALVNFQKEGPQSEIIGRQLSLDVEALSCCEMAYSQSPSWRSGLLFDWLDHATSKGPFKGNVELVLLRDNLLTLSKKGCEVEVFLAWTQNINIANTMTVTYGLGELVHWSMGCRVGDLGTLKGQM